MRSKQCSKCGETKTLAEFRRDRRRRDGLQSSCKSCRRAYDEAHREERRAYMRAYREANREEIRDRSRAYREDHREERNALNLKRETEALKASREVATRNGEPWTPAEAHVVLTSEGTVLDIAIELGRTTSSVRTRRELLRRKAVTV